MEVYRAYFRMLNERSELFKRAFEIAERVGERAKELFGVCEVYLIGSFARGEHKLSSDLDILLVVPGVPDKLDFDWYMMILKELSCGEEVNLHILNPEAFKKSKGIYRNRIRVV